MKEASNKNQRVTTIPVVEETVEVNNKIVDGDSVRIRKSVDEENVMVPLLSKSHGYSIEHITVNKLVDQPPPAIRYEGEVMVISVLEEEAVVLKRLRLVEEIRITPFGIENVSEIQLTLKKERITIEKDPPEKG